MSKPVDDPFTPLVPPVRSEQRCGEAADLGVEVERLRAELAAKHRQFEISRIQLNEMSRDYEQAEAERDALKATITRVRAVHVISDLGECTDCRASWPCPTITALPETEEADG
jgi:hypothetical protein